MAIARYVIRKSGKNELLGKNAKDEAMMDNLLAVWWDTIIMGLVQLLLNKKVMDVKAGHYFKNKSKYEKF